MSGFETVRMARKRHQCTKCLGTIEPGEFYVDGRLPPNSDIGNDGWLRLAWHIGAYGRKPCA